MKLTQFVWKVTHIVPPILKVIYLVIAIIPKGEFLNGWPEPQELFLRMPPGTTLAECIADHTPAVDHAPDGAQMMGWRCIEIDLLPTSKA